MGPLVLTNLGLKTLVTNAVQAAAGVKGVFNGAYIALLTADFTPTAARVLGDLTEAAWTAYARGAVTWGPPKLLQNGNWGAVADVVLTWSIGVSDPSTVVYGYALVTATTAGALLGLGKFDAPFPLTSADAEIALVPEMQLPSSTDWGRAALLG